MTEQEFLALVRQNSINAAILDRLPQLEAFAPGVMLVAGSLFGTVWNAQAGNAPTDHIKDYDLFSWDADLSSEAEDAVIRQTAELFADLNAPIEIRNQARVHLWFNPKYGLNRPPLCSVREGIEHLTEKAQRFCPTCKAAKQSRASEFRRAGRTCKAAKQRMEQVAVLSQRTRNSENCSRPVSD
ncbi:nucleotidyltransferase family protein [Deinococcus wulumuqiensis]|uniref:nucleotidyltransferase family protein n=1 Tax=Deinococcus wulumuqiensis TaxID=980427 RepID=UPI00242E052E|nr:nucleotidyltransferase family protein [Deinococcus wulumuqiensis]